MLVTDVNDMPPVFSKDEWVVEVNETEEVVDSAVLTVTVIDLDETNNFFYKVNISNIKILRKNIISLSVRLSNYYSTTISGC